MDKAVLKNFAIESRKDLMEKIDRKIKLFYVDEEFKKDNRGDVIVLSNDKHTLTLTKEEDSDRDKLIRRIVELGYNQVVEEAAYTWFNRIIAIRYMEVNDYLPLTKNNQPLNINVLSSKDNKVEPEILKFSNLLNPELDIDFNKNIYSELKDDNEKFKYILLLICKKLGRVIPQVFDGVTDYIDILIPDYLLGDTGFVKKVVLDIPIDNFKKVEIIGWLYQYYNQTEKERVISAKKANNKNEIAYATQLFTPEWVVKYMVENTIGEYLSIEEQSNLNYLVSKKQKKDSFEIEKLKFLDPCCGSGHILVYAFDLFYKIYLENGYLSSNIPELILKNNIYGLDVDDRAGQLTILSILLKARQYDRNIFNKEVLKDLNIVSIQDSNNIRTDIIDELKNEESKKIAEYLIAIFKNGKEIGSLTNVEKQNYNLIIDDINSNNTIFAYELKDKLFPLIRQAKILSDKYDIVVTNPPYMTSTAMTKALKDYVSLNYKKGKNDLFSAFIIKNNNFCKENGSLGFMTPYVWMFISSYEELREYILSNSSFKTLVQMEYSALEEAVVPLCSFVLTKKENENGQFFRLTDFTGGMKVQDEKFKEILSKNDKRYIFERNSRDFNKIPSSIIAYWINEETIESFDKKKRVKDYVQSSVGIQTGDNDKFLHFWWEVDFNNIGFNIKSLDDTFNTKKWYPYNKGGEYRKWYGNDDLVIDWQNDGANIKRNSEVTHHHYQQYSDNLKFKRLVTWSRITSGTPSFRYKDFGYLSDMAGFSVFAEEKILKHLLAFCNSSVAKYYLEFLAPTLNIMVGSVNSMPYTYKENDEIDKLVNSNLNITKQDWDRFETSWNFKSHPLISSEKLSIEKMISVFAEKCNKDFDLLKNNEEKINSIFINDYGLSNSLSNIVDPKEVSVRKCNQIREIKSLISYAVGCMFGRYSLDEEGIIYAGGSFNKNIYKKITPDEDNIIPISESKNVYYNDDIVSRFVEFIKIAFGSENLNQNLEYIAVTLGKRGTETSEDTIRRYFVNDFYNDHIKIYQKRPIYWLFDSGRKNGFKCLIYVHRYDEQIVSKIRTKYLHNTISIYQRIIEDIDYKLNNEELNTSDKRELINNKNDINIKITECNNYEEMVGNVANKMIKLDLDDGVLVNYAKFVDDNGKSILAKIK